MSNRNHEINRREFIRKSAAGLAAAGMLNSVQCTERVEMPNIIYILADDLGYGDLGCYGQKEIKTPNIDRLAAEGMRFTSHYAGSTVCAPSRCSLMTGMHTGHTVVRGNRETRPMGQHPLPPETVTVAELLKDAGYTTGLIGKWGLGGPDSTGIPNRQGFDYFYGYLCQRHAHNYYPEFLFRNEERVPLEGNRIENPRPDGAGVAVEKVQYSHDLIGEEALAFVERNRNKPFFLYWSPTIPHANNEAGSEGMEVPDDAPYSERDWPQQQKNHAAMITRLDRDVGALMEKLKELGIDENTIVLFTSDNGPHREGGANPSFFASSGPLRGIKRDLYEGGIRVPMIARWPGRIEPGSVSDHVSAFWDFLPTAADIAGCGTPENIDGISYLPALLGGTQSGHEFLYWEFHEGKASKQAVRAGKWKAVRLSPSAPLELYDLSADIGENSNIAASHPDVIKRMEKYLQSARTESEIWKLIDG